MLDNARQAVRDINAIAYIGDRDSAATALSLPLTNEGGILQVSPTSSYDGLTRAGGVRTGEPERFYPAATHTFGRMVPPDHVQASALVGYMKTEGVRKLALIGDRELEGGGLADQVDHGGRARRASPSSTRAASTRRRASSRGHAVRRRRDRRRRVPLRRRHEHRRGADRRRPSATRRRGMLLFGPAPFAEPELHRRRQPRPCASACGSRRRRCRRACCRRPRASSATQFRAAFGRAPAPEALLSYEATQAVLASIRAAGAKGNDRAAVIRAFFAIRNRKSVLGTYSIDRSGTPA